ncbi:MAG TPA: alpha/beta hydrolase domain-containing protein, partial [Acetobacteraceae bacterium]
ANSYGGVQRPAMRYTGAHNPLHAYDRGPQYRAADTSGVETMVPPRPGAASYGVLVPQVDADGNDLGGIRSLFQQVPIGTYTGWNSFRPDWFGGGPCTLVGSFVPFAANKAEREAAADPRPSLEERYPNKPAYVNAVREAADRLVAARFLLPDDAYRLISEAEEKGVRTGP